MKAPDAPRWPYPGLESYQDRHEDRLLFFGREAEATTLVNLVVGERLSLLYARSGLGKTSLINAGALHQLRARGFFPIVARVTQNVPERVREEVERQQVAIKEEPAAGTLWEYFHAARFVMGGEPVRPILVLDQFEELFTRTRLEAPAAYEAFVTQLADVVRGRMPAEGRAAALERAEQLSRDDPQRRHLLAILYEDAGPDLKVLISIREDFLPDLEMLQDQIPGIFRCALRLRPLSREQAREAIVKPAGQAEILGDDIFDFEAAAVDQMLAFLSGHRVGGQLTEGDTIEPVQLQLLCQELNRRRHHRGAKVITVADLKGPRGMKRILEKYYADVLRRFRWIRLGWSGRRWKPALSNALLLHWPRAAIRALCERGLITPTGRRNSLIEDVILKQYGVAKVDLEGLVTARMLRQEPRLDSYFYELTHDSLVGPLLAARRRGRYVKIVAVLLLAAPYVLQGFEAANEFAVKRQLRVLEAPETGREQREAVVANLIARGHRNFAGANLSGINLKDKSLFGATFTDAKLRNATFDRAKLAQSRFQRADLSSASLVGAQLQDADLTQAVLAGANLSAVSMSDADLSRANLTRAILNSATLRRTRMTDTTITNTQFTDTEWWLAAGWSDDQVRLLSRAWPYREFAKTDRYRAGLRAASVAVEAAKSSLERASALNERAWYRALRGAELRASLADAEEAVKILRDAQSGAEGWVEADRQGLLGTTMNTLGYVLLQLDRPAEAEPYLADALRTVEILGYSKRALGEMEYHLALARHRIGELDSARVFFDGSKKKGYEPSYEVVLTPLTGRP